MLMCKYKGLINNDISDVDPEADDDSISTTVSSEKSIRYLSRINKKKTNDFCYAQTILEEYGNIYVVKSEMTFFISKIRKIKFNDSNELFEKGKRYLGNYFKEDLNSIPDITFWYQRYYYYSRFDDGIQMDYESWWSVTPEELAAYTANLCIDKVVVDAFCGSGGNVIQFSKFCKKVYAIDIDENKLNICKNNARIYECGDNIEYIKSDFLKVNKIKADYVFLSPPWGGVKYKENNIYSIREQMKPSIYDIVRNSLKIAKNIIFYLPRNMLIVELFEVIKSVYQDMGIKKEKIYLDIQILKSANKIKALMLIFGHDIYTDITNNDLKEYLNFNYKYLNSSNIQTLLNITKIIGNYKFLQIEYDLKQLYLSNNLYQPMSFSKILIKYFINQILNESELSRLKALDKTKSYDVNFYYKNYKKKIFKK